MAFNKPDIEKYYQNLVKPVLTKNTVIPIMMSENLSNKDINTQINENLKKSDFAIVDLTYARPNVYYEAGFAERKIPVIYTVRYDHLQKNQPDDLKVHFDLNQSL